jgi:uncharacterized protein with PIN domain
MENYISRMNIERYRLLLRTVTDQFERQVIKELPAEEEAKPSSQGRQASWFGIHRASQPSSDETRCIKCGSEMQFVTIMPVLFSGGLDELAYQCENCGGEVKHTTKSHSY